MSKLSDTTAASIIGAVNGRRAELVDLTRRWIQVESITGNEGVIQEDIARELRRMGLTVDVWVPNLMELATHPAYQAIDGLDFSNRPNVVGVWKGSGGGRSLLFNGHVDTIPVEPIAGWTHGPFAARVEQDRVYGRGASDMKGGLAAMTMAVKVLRDLGLQPRGDVILEYVVDEELTGYGTLSAVQRGYRADGGISLETSDLHIQPACIGRLWFTVTVMGQAVGIARHWEGVSAIDKGITIVQAIKELEQRRWAEVRHPLYPDNRSALPCVVCMFQAGMFPSALPDSAVLRGSLGVLPQESVKDVERQVTDEILRVAEVDPWLRAHPPVVDFKEVGADGAEIPVDHPIVQTVARAYTRATGQAPVISGRTGGADTRYLIKHGQTPTVIFGPGMTAEMHAVNESVPIDSLLTATQTLALAVLEWCGEA